MKSLLSEWKSFGKIRPTWYGASAVQSRKIIKKCLSKIGETYEMLWFFNDFLEIKSQKSLPELHLEFENHWRNRIVSEHNFCEGDRMCEYFFSKIWYTFFNTPSYPPVPVWIVEAGQNFNSVNMAVLQRHLCIYVNDLEI